MKITLFLLFAFTVVFAANSPFSRIRVAAYDSDGVPSEEVHDISICLERNPTMDEKRKYEEVLGYYADGIYEATNGANIGVSDVWVYGSDVYPKMDDAKERFDFGITLAHETIHLRYALDDDYAKTTSTNYGVTLLADSHNDAIVVMLDDINNEELLYRYKTWLQTTFSSGSPIRFFGIGEGRVPDGLDMGPVPYGRDHDFGHFVTDYPIIDQVDASSLELGYYSFNLKDNGASTVLMMFRLLIL